MPGQDVLGFNLNSAPRAQVQSNIYFAEMAYAILENITANWTKGHEFRKDVVNFQKLVDQMGDNYTETYALSFPCEAVIMKLADAIDGDGVSMHEAYVQSVGYIKSAPDTVIPASQKEALLAEMKDLFGGEANRLLHSKAVAGGKLALDTAKIAITLDSTDAKNDVMAKTRKKRRIV